MHNIKPSYVMSHFTKEFDRDIPDPSQVRSIYIDKTRPSSDFGGSNYVVAFHVARFGTQSYRVPVAEALQLAKEKINDFDTVAIVLSGRAGPQLKGNKAVGALLGQPDVQFPRQSGGVSEYDPMKTIRTTGATLKL